MITCLVTVCIYFILQIITISSLRFSVINMAAEKGFGAKRTIPKPKIITPSVGKVNTQLEKFLMMYTCKQCDGRNAQMVSKVAYTQGTVVSTCKHCGIKHLIADNKCLLDLPEYGKRIEEYLERNGEKVQRITLSNKDLDENYLVDSDGIITIVPKMGGQLSPDVTIVEYPSAATTETDLSRS
jgi:transcription elongation factor Elf1